MALLLDGVFLKKGAGLHESFSSPLLLVLMVSQGPFLQASKPAQPGPQIATGDDSRAEEWRELRRQKGQEIIPPKSSGIEKAFIEIMARVQMCLS